MMIQRSHITDLRCLPSRTPSHSGSNKKRTSTQPWPHPLCSIPRTTILEQDHLIIADTCFDLHPLLHRRGSQKL